MGAKKAKVKTQYEIMKSTRGSWNGTNPVTKVVQDKTKYIRKCAKTELRPLRRDADSAPFSISFVNVWTKINI